MKKLNIRLNSNVLAQIQNLLFVLTLSTAILSKILNFATVEIFKQKYEFFNFIFVLCLIIFFIEIILIYIFSRISPCKNLRLRKKLILFTEQLTKQVNDGHLMHSIEWHYKINKKIIKIEMHSRGLVSDREQLSRQLSEYLNENLLSFVEVNNHVEFIFGDYPKRYNAMEILTNEKL